MKVALNEGCGETRQAAAETSSGWPTLFSDKNPT
jgi:hypothetical protein